MNFAAIKEALRMLWLQINPWYRNPIVDYLDLEHLKDRRPFKDPQFTQKVIRSVLASNRHVKDAIHDFREGEYLIETALVDTAVHAMVFRIEDYDEHHAPAAIMNADWIEDFMPCYTIKVTSERASLAELQAPAVGCYYNPRDAIMCWTIPLSEDFQYQLGLLKLGTHR